MKKIFVVLGLITALPAFADPTIGYDNGSYTYNESTTDGSNMCVYDVLDTYTGPANLQAQWDANEIQLRWFNENTQIIPANESKTCEYDLGLTIPATAPSRTGYTFAGWHVRPVTTFSNSALSMTSTGLERWGKGHVVNTTTPYCYHKLGDGNADHVDCNSDPHFTEMNIDEWQMRYDNNGKTLYGMAHCSGKSGNNSDNTWPQTSDTTISQWQVLNKSTLESASGEKKYCWCKATGYKANSSAIKQGADTPLAWVFSYAHSSASLCAAGCAFRCAYYAQTNSAFRAALFLGAGTAE